MKPGREADLLEAIEQETLGQGSIAEGEYLRNMQDARLCADQTARWVEVCYCPTPLQEERPYWEQYFNLARVQDAHEIRGQVFRGRAFAIAAASESRLGGMRALAALRLILSACHATVIPSQLALSFAGQAYDDMDRLKHPPDIEALGALVRQLIDVSQRMM